ncbi:Aspartic peptidase domain,Glycoside hydrolase family 1,Glycoside hydrolase superfamily,Glycoside [Cinara cedri]|uniref:beta-glucosidase n=1 Tax=Cinara cedri TaxID=506608 RepID=A0A5E4MAD6_9HEMI|nr:Aspartic peptidase domain,Glycoside hydrolase family 1,Glycoside hydrolase superfamily,Glycoside [Cinara cedri]
MGVSPSPGAKFAKLKTVKDRVLVHGEELTASGSPAHFNDWRVDFEGPLRRPKNGRTLDFLGINHYFSVYATKLHKNKELPLKSLDSSFELSLIKELPHSNPMWIKETPKGMRYLLCWIKETYGNPKVLITENGVSGNEQNEDYDQFIKIRYHYGYLSAVLNAIYEDGCNVIGYGVWSFLDSFEWFYGYEITCVFAHRYHRYPPALSDRSSRITVFPGALSSREPVPLTHSTSVCVCDLRRTVVVVLVKVTLTVTLSNNTRGFNLNRDKKNPVQRSEQKKSKVALLSSKAPVTPASKCFVCSGDHPTASCTEFAAMSLDNRCQAAKDRKICLRCLNSTHWSNRCTAKPFGSLERPTVLLGTEIVHIRNCGGYAQPVRALIDSASQISVISSAYADRLGLRRSKWTTPLTSLSGMQVPKVNGMILDRKQVIVDSSLPTAPFGSLFGWILIGPVPDHDPDKIHSNVVALTVSLESVETVLGAAKFKFKKWSSNAPQILASIPPEDRAQNVVDFDDTEMRSPYIDQRQDSAVFGHECPFSRSTMWLLQCIGARVRSRCLSPIEPSKWSFRHLSTWFQNQNGSHERNYCTPT